MCTKLFEIKLWQISVSINSAKLCLSVWLIAVLFKTSMVWLYGCISVSLYIAYLANLSHDRLRARPVCCTGPENVHCQGLGANIEMHILMSFCAVHSLAFYGPHLGPWRTIYNSVYVTDHILNGQVALGGARWR